MYEDEKDIIADALTGVKVYKSIEVDILAYELHNNTPTSDYIGYCCRSSQVSNLMFLYLPKDIIPKLGSVIQVDMKLLRHHTYQAYSSSIKEVRFPYW